MVAPSSTTLISSENKNLQSFYLLHKPSTRVSQKKSTARKIDLSPIKDVKPNTSAQLDTHKPFHAVWSKIDSSIKAILRDINTDVFDEIQCWVCLSFLAITSSGMPSFAQFSSSSLLAENMEFIDDLLTFQELGTCLKSHGCHVANLSSLDFFTKNGVSGLRSLLRQFLMVTLDAPDVSVLVSWYREQGNYDAPVVIIIDAMEHCCC